MKREKKRKIIRETVVITRKAFSNTLEMVVSMSVIFAMEVCIGLVRHISLSECITVLASCSIFILLFLMMHYLRQEYIRRTELQGISECILYGIFCILTTVGEIFFLIMILGFSKQLFL